MTVEIGFCGKCCHRIVAQGPLILIGCKIEGNPQAGKNCPLVGKSRGDGPALPGKTAALKESPTV